MKKYFTVSKNYKINESLEKANKIVDLLTRENELKIIEISNATKLNVSTIYRYMYSLEKLGIIERSPFNKDYYRLSLKLFSIGSSINVRRNESILNCSINEMNNLFKKYKESLNLSTFDNNEIMYIYKISTTHDIKYEIQIGSRHPAYCTASGKIFLAFQDNEFIDSYFKELDLVKFTKNTIVDINELKIVLEKTKINKYSIDKEEYINGVTCFAVPIESEHCNVNFALVMVIPTSRLQLYSTSQIINDLLESSKNISLTQ